MNRLFFVAVLMVLVLGGCDTDSPKPAVPIASKDSVPVSNTSAQLNLVEAQDGHQYIVGTYYVYQGTAISVVHAAGCKTCKEEAAASVKSAPAEKE